MSGKHEAQNTNKESRIIKHEARTLRREEKAAENNHRAPSHEAKAPEQERAAAVSETENTARARRAEKRTSFRPERKKSAPADAEAKTEQGAEGSRTNKFDHRLLVEAVLFFALAVFACLYFLKPQQIVIQPERDDDVQTVQVQKPLYELKDSGKKFLEMDNEFFRPADPFTHSEMARMIYLLLGTDKVGNATFLDLTKDDDCYKAAATLKTLGIVSGARFHPDDPVTFEEFNDVLSYFGKEIEAKEEDMTRRDAAVVMSKILGRKPAADFSKIGTILDVSKDDEAFYIIADAALSKTLPVKEPGYYFYGDTLHLIDEKGCVVADKTVDGFTFDGNGQYTSGNRELDAVVQEILKKVLVETVEHPFRRDGNLKGNDEYALKLLYEYVIHNSKYVPRNFYKTGDISWAADEALVMLTTGRGNCYNYAAAFYELARAYGYKAELFSGTMGENDDPHSWVEIEFNGEAKLFDPEVESTKNDWEFTSYFKRDQSFAHKYDYKKS